jgi:AraC family ethanolamine operon transcriptional activator
VALLRQLADSDFLKISPSPGFDHFRSIERLGEANSIPLDCKGFASAFAAVTLKSCSIYLQRTFPRILQARYSTPGAIVGFAMNESASVILDGVEGRAPAILLVRGKAVCEIVEPQANLIAFVNFNAIDDRGWPGERDRAQLIAIEHARFERLQAITGAILLLAANSPGAFLEPLMIESVEESILQAVDLALHTTLPAIDGKRSNLTNYVALVRRFDEFLAADAGRTLYSAETARQLGVSVRTLHNAVVAIRGMSMHRYTRLRRLWNVRQQLVRAAPTVAIEAVALVNGFWHMGEFISLYRDLFCETPRQTLAAARSQQGGLS